MLDCGVDRTWSRSNSEGGWPDSSSVSDDSKEWPNTSQASNQAFTDLVPEFEPGKPWKVTNLYKNFLPLMKKWLQQLTRLRKELEIFGTRQ